jgi:hypothetical protein
MGSESDLDLLADSIAKLQDELAQLLSGEDKTEIEALLELTALLELAREAYTVIQARLENAASRRRSNRRSQYLQRLDAPNSTANLQRASDQMGPPGSAKVLG